MLNRFSYLFILLLIAVSAFLYLEFSSESDSYTPAFVGTQRCRDCHEASSIGSQFDVWDTTEHAGARRTLDSSIATAYINRRGTGIADCLGCHTTLGRTFTTEREESLVLEGVGCERCHGPGSNYSEYNVMIDREAFLAAGGNIGSLKDCYGCHSANPAHDSTHCPFQTEPFNADSAWGLIAHPVPQGYEPRDSIRYLRQ